MRKLNIKINWNAVVDVIAIATLIIVGGFAINGVTSSIRSDGFEDGYWSGYDDGSERYWQEFMDARNSGMEQHEMLIHALEYFNCDSDQCIYEATGDCSFYGAPTAYCKL